MFPYFEVVRAHFAGISKNHARRQRALEVYDSVGYGRVEPMSFRDMLKKNKKHKQTSTVVIYCISSKTGFIVSVHRSLNITLLTLVQANSKGSRRPISLMKTHTQ